jgi:hypothetical protein
MVGISNRFGRRAVRLLAAFAVAAACAGVFAGTALANQISISGSMEGSIKISPGDWVAAGYDITIPGGHPAETVQLANAQVVISGSCTNGGSDSIVIPLSAGPYNIPANDSNWWPSGNENDPLVYQGAVQAPAGLCGGTGQLNGSGGATITGDLQSTVTNTAVHIRFHYRDPNAKGKGNVNCSSGSYASDVCGASWSGTNSYLPDVWVPLATIGGLLLAVLMAGGLVLQQKRTRRKRQARALAGGA